MTDSLSYRIDVLRRSLASTTRPDGSVELTREAVIELLELLEAAGGIAGEFDRLRARLLEVVNDPTHRVLTIPLRDVAAVLNPR